MKRRYLNQNEALAVAEQNYDCELLSARGFNSHTEWKEFNRLYHRNYCQFGKFYRLPHFFHCRDYGEMSRLPRFKRVSPVSPIQLGQRDRDIIRLVHRHHFLRSGRIVALLGGSQQQILRRLQLLFHHGYLDRPRAQIRYYERGGSQAIVYGLANLGGQLLREELGIAIDSVSWSQKNHAIGRVFLEHTLLVSDVMVSFEIACRKRGVKLLYEDQLKQKTKQWRVQIDERIKLGVVPDRLFALEFADYGGQVQRAYFFLEADRGTMPIKRRTLSQSSFYRKLLAYEATWTGKVHQRHLGIPRFRVLTVTTIAARIVSLLAACSQLKRGHGLFLFADQSILEKDPFSAVWRNGKTGQLSPLLDLPSGSLEM